MSSGGPACRNPEHRPYWRVAVREGNHSAFNGYHFTRSAYSSLFCQAPNTLGPCCDELTITTWRTSWRTKAAYVAEVPDVGYSGGGYDEFLEF